MSVNGFNWISMVLKCFKWFYIVVNGFNGFKWFWNVSIGFKLVQMVLKCFKWFYLVLNGFNGFK